VSGLLVMGAGGHGRVVASSAFQTRRWTQIAFLDDKYPGVGAVDDMPVLGPFADAASLHSRFPEAVVALGESHLRMRILRELQEMGFGLPVVVHPAAWVSSSATLGAGTVVFAHGVVNPGARLGQGCIVNTAATVDHDCQIGDGVHLSPGVHLGGEVTVGEHTWLGLGANIKHGVTIGKDVIVGVGAAVVCDLPDGVTAMGVPARIVETREATP